jgi:hypothetical protein
METFHGDLLIGGMRLRDLDGFIDGDPAGESGRWSGQFVLDRTQVHSLQVGRPYLLQLDDGRTARVVVSRMDVPVGHVRLRIEFEGQSALVTSSVMER